MRQHRSGSAWAAVVAALGLCFSASAVAANSTAAPQAPSELDKAFEAAKSVTQAGPAVVKFRDQAQLNLPGGLVFIPPPAAARIMTAMGNSTGDNFLGLVFPRGEANWFVVAHYESSGYIKDDDAKKWDVQQLYTSLKEGTEEANKERKSRGFPEMEILGWVERPQYDASTHRLVWSLSARDKSADQNAPQTVNYNTYLLGREGYISMNLITDSGRIAENKVSARTLLAALRFEPGKTYAQYKPGTDKLAEYGLAALIGGIAVKKLGLLALAAGFFVKFAKLIAVGAVAGTALLRKFFGRSKGDTNDA